MGEEGRAARVVMSSLLPPGGPPARSPVPDFSEREADPFHVSSVEAKPATRTELATTRPHALESWATLRSAIGDRRPVLFIDYDGTLAAIVRDPDKAFMTQSMRAALRRAAKVFTTAIITGRSKDKVYQFVGLDDVFYAGSHGLDIQGPSATAVSCQVADKFRPILKRTQQELEVAIARIDGAKVEDNTFALSVHYRNVSPDQTDEVFEIVEAQLASLASTCESTLELRHGKKVLELRPQVDWNKGSAVLWILEALGLRQQNDRIFPIYLGDDITDEDAFLALKQQFSPESSAGILVRDEHDTERPAETHASFVLRSPAEVEVFLEMLVNDTQYGSKSGPEPQSPVPTQPNVTVPPTANMTMNVNVLSPSPPVSPSPAARPLSLVTATSPTGPAPSVGGEGSGFESAALAPMLNTVETAASADPGGAAVSPPANFSLSQPPPSLHSTHGPQSSVERPGLLEC